MSSIKCRSCQSPMLLESSESSQHAKICWHRCPLCKQVRMTSDPTVGKSSLAMSGHKDEDRTYFAEPDTFQPESQYGFAAYLMT